MFITVSYAGLRVCDCSLALAHDSVRIVHKVDRTVGVLIRLGHLFGRILQAHDLGTDLADVRLGDSKHITVKIVETLSNIPGELQMLHLIDANRNHICLIKENVRRHQNRIREKTGIDIVGMLRGFILELRHTIELAHIRITVEDPGKLRVAGYM